MSRGGTGCSPRTTTTSLKTSSSRLAGSPPPAAGPVNRPRRNQRGPSAPMNRTSCIPEAGCPGSIGHLGDELGAEQPFGLLGLPARLGDLPAMSARTSSHSALRRAAANAWICISLSPCRTVTQAPCCSAMTSWISCSGPTGTCRLPRSTRSRAGKGSPASHGPPSARGSPAGSRGRLVLGQLVVGLVIEFIVGQALRIVLRPVPANVR